MMQGWLLTDSGCSGDSAFIFFRGVEVLLKAMTTILRGGQRQLRYGYMGSLVTVSWFMILYICLPLPISVLESLGGRFVRTSEVGPGGAMD